MPAAWTDYLNAPSGGLLTPKIGVFVRLRNNATSTDYFSTAATDGQGLFTVNNIPPGVYSVFIGTAANLGATPTATGDVNYTVSITPSDATGVNTNLALQSLTVVPNGPYTPPAGTLGGDANVLGGVLTVGATGSLRGAVDLSMGPVALPLEATPSSGFNPAGEIPSYRIGRIPNTLIEQGRWIRSVNNPIMSATVGWEKTAVQEPCVIFDWASQKYRMWYRGGWLAADQAIGYATASAFDGPWTKYAGNPILGPSGMTAPFVVIVGGLHYLYLTQSGPIVVRTSGGGITGWSAATTCFTLPFTNSLGHSCTACGNKVIWREQGVWKMLFEAIDSTTNLWFIYYATAPDGINFTIQNSAAPYLSLQVGSGMSGGIKSVYSIDGKYHVWYHASTPAATTPTDIYHASNANLATDTWTVVSPNPILTHNAGTYEHDQIADPSVMEINGQAYMFLDGDNNGTSTAYILAANAKASLDEIINGAPSSATASPARPIQVFNGVNGNFTPDPNQGELFLLNMAGNVVIKSVLNSFGGQMMVLIASQDAPGGRTWTYDADYQTNWQPVAQANCLSSLTLVRDATNSLWRQVDGAVAVAHDGTVQFRDHLISAQTVTPATSNLGANVTSATPTGNDERGKIVIVMSAGLAANTRICTVTWGRSFINGTAPDPLLANQTSGVGLANVNFYAGAQAVASFDLFCNQALVAGTYTVKYWNVQ